MPYPIPTMKEQFENLSNSKNFICRFHWMKNQKETAFITPDETGEIERMVYGLTNAPYESDESSVRTTKTDSLHDLN